MPDGHLLAGWSLGLVRGCEELQQGCWSSGMAVQVLTTAESNKGLIRIDPLQRLHTLTNLLELLAAGVRGIARTLRDDQLQSQAEEIRQVSAFLKLLCFLTRWKCAERR